jgi:hypothetical protein
MKHVLPNTRQAVLRGLSTPRIGQKLRRWTIGLLAIAFVSLCLGMQILRASITLWDLEWEEDPLKVFFPQGSGIPSAGLSPEIRFTYRLVTHIGLFVCPIPLTDSLFRPPRS